MVRLQAWVLGHVYLEAIQLDLSADDIVVVLRDCAGAIEWAEKIKRDKPSKSGKPSKRR